MNEIWPDFRGACSRERFLVYQYNWKHCKQEQHNNKASLGESNFQTFFQARASCEFFEGVSGVSPGQACPESLPGWRTSSVPHSRNCKRLLTRTWVSKRVKQRKPWVRLPWVQAKHGSQAWTTCSHHQNYAWSFLGVFISLPCSSFSLSDFPMRLCVNTCSILSLYLD